MNQCTPDHVLTFTVVSHQRTCNAGETGMVRARVGVPESPDPPCSGPTCPIYILTFHTNCTIHTYSYLKSLKLEQPQSIFFSIFFLQKSTQIVNQNKNKNKNKTCLVAQNHTNSHLFKIFRNTMFYLSIKKIKYSDDDEYGQIE
jgi:hypothetical protein